MSNITLQNNHPATTNTEGQLRVGHEDIHLSLPSACAEITRIVIRSDAPLSVAAHSPAGVRLQPGWDGSLGYACYAIELAPGCTTAILARTPPSGDPHHVDDLSQRHQPVPTTRAEIGDWQARRRSEFAARILEPHVTYDSPDHPPTASNARCDSREEKNGFAVESWRCTTRPGREIPFLLARPLQQPPRGLLVALHGHEGTWGGTDMAAFSPGHTDSFCHAFAAAGWAVVQPATMNHQLDSPDWTLLGTWCWDAMACLGTASALVGPVPTSAVCGLSAGGQIAMAMLALDRRLKAGVVAGSFSTWHHFSQRMIIPPHCDCGTTMLLGGWLEQADWLSLAAPCPVQIQHGRADSCFGPGADPRLLDPKWNRGVMPVAEFSAATAIVSQTWAILGAGNDLEVHLHDEGHAVNEAAAIAWCERSVTQQPTL